MTADFTDAERVLGDAITACAFPAAVAEVGDATQPLWRRAFGRLTFETGSPAATDDTVFDLASLTKVLATTPLVIRAVERGMLDLEDPVARHLPAWSTADRAGVTIRDLLSHCSGLPAHRRYYETLSGSAAFEAAICAEPLEYQPRSRSTYSDLGFMLLGFLLERTATLPQLFDTLRLQMGGIQDLQFHPPELWRRRTAPTEVDPFRGRLLLAEVDDTNTWALGGAAGQAGLFGTTAAVGECARHLLQVLDGRRGAFRSDTLTTFITRRAAVPGSPRALGWDTMLPTSSCGTRMSASAFGHTGYTGTSLWIDPVRAVYVVLLTNRIHPRAENHAITHVRPAFHDAVIDAIDRGNGRHRG